MSDVEANWSAYKSEFVWAGTLRDIYVRNTDLPRLETFRLDTLPPIVPTAKNTDAPSKPDDEDP